ncbi:sirohydrochlorin chelatase [Mycolicibacterium flavescens]|uniref:Sirohydrochlorin ferrochelatase n=1 Tax=Mycolicibacterium flavescens TaxID=1776 RepID=A0A1E3RMS2_MYCFV|nr:sirohydrochlorin chelatase [Mycolicibacterium flavescens]MCV7281294.1 sirohydrochlorin chelatase [Mycolicibacterium flavescens]ODQ91195.1 sirohydrochlorin ferrochelatase [Mycolicibacterium flavescens]
MTLVLTAHGSADPRSAAVTHAVAGRIRRLRPWLDVRAAFLEQTGPDLGEVLRGLDGPAVVVPFLLASAFHARIDIPAVIEESRAVVDRAEVLGEDPALLTVLRQRLTETGVSPDDDDLGVLVVAVGSSHPAANARTATVAQHLSRGTRWAATEVAFATGPYAGVAEAADRLRARGAERLVIAPWFLAHGRITDRVASYAAAQSIPMSEPLGSHNLVAATVLDRYDAVTAVDVAA